MSDTFNPKTGSVNNNTGSVYNANSSGDILVNIKPQKVICPEVQPNCDVISTNLGTPFAISGILDVSGYVGFDTSGTGVTFSEGDVVSVNTNDFRANNNYYVTDVVGFTIVTSKPYDSCLGTGTEVSGIGS